MVEELVMRAEQGAGSAGGFGYEVVKTLTG
jgi:hypothetical protein